jgi:cellulose biosynthesis protein BcsQ
VSVPVIAFFSNKEGVGTTSLVYHLAWMFSDLQVKVLAVDLDPQANLTTAFVGGTSASLHDLTVYECIRRILGADTDSSIGQPIGPNLVLLPSDLMLSAFEEELAMEWQRAQNGDKQAFRIVSAPWRVMRMLAQNHEAQLILVDLGPNLSSINRAGLLATDHVVLPLAPDQFSVLGLEILGSTLRKWRGDWRERLTSNPSKDMELPAGGMKPLGYVVQQPGIAMRTNEDWINWIPNYYREFVLDAPSTVSVSIFNDPEKLSVLRPYRTLIPMAQEARKPMFHLKPADGAIGAHLHSAEEARKDFDALARAIVAKANLPVTLR